MRVAHLYLRRLEDKGHTQKLTVLEERRRDKLNKRLVTLENTASLAYLRNMLQRHLRARFLKPQRITQLTPTEEFQRAKSTWQEATFMSENFVNPDQASQNMRQAVLLFSDQVPCWLKVSAGRQSYIEKEIRPRKTKATQSSDLLLQHSGQALMTQRVEMELVEAAEEAEVKAAAVEDQESALLQEPNGQHEPYLFHTT